MSNKQRLSEMEEMDDFVGELRTTKNNSKQGGTNMANFRKSIRESMSSNASPAQTKTMRKSITNTIHRASVKFELKDGSDAGNLAIENERLKTTIMVLQQKIKVGDMNDE